MGTASSKSWSQQLIETDTVDDQMGNLSYIDSINHYDTGKARTRLYLIGITWYMSLSFRITLGMSDLWGDNPTTGKHFKDNQLDRVKNESGDTIKEQLESNKSLQAGTGITSLSMNDFGGTARHDKEFWIRTEFKF